MLGGKRKTAEVNFYNLFIEFMSKILSAGLAFEELVRIYDDVPNRIGDLKVMETECDMQTHKILKQLNDSKNTPFEREDIHALAKEMDEIVDNIEEAASRFSMFGITEMRPEAVGMASLILKAIEELEILFLHLREANKNSKVMDQIIEINRIENEGDVLHRSTLSRLFQEEKNPIELIKWKHLYEEMEEALDACESVANMVEGILMKAATK